MEAADKKRLDVEETLDNEVDVEEAITHPMNLCTLQKYEIMKVNQTNITMTRWQFSFELILVITSIKGTRNSFGMKILIGTYYITTH